MYVGSYLWRLRQKVGQQLVLMPGVMVVIERADGAVLWQRRGDTGEWGLPGGAAEAGGSFARTALAELAEEVGIQVEAADLIPFGTLSEAERHTIAYPSGDVTHCFALCFAVRHWRGVPRAADAESTEVAFFDPATIPSPAHQPAALTLALYRQFKATGRFQVS